MPSVRKSWREKLADKSAFPKILKLERSFPCYNALHKMGVEVGQRVVLVNPSEVVEVMKKVPRGKLITINEICRKIAQNHRVSGCCSLTTGIYIMIAANASEEARREGKDMDLPYWRTLKANGFLNEKYPGGSMAQMEMLRKEGFQIKRHVNKFAVEGFERNLWISF